MSRPRAALAGAAAALVWGALEPIDKRIFLNDYSDVAVLGKFVTRTRAWPIAGIGFHAVNGALFGIAFDEARKRTTVPPRGEPGVGTLFNRRGFAQATARHALFGAVLGRLAG